MKRKMKIFEILILTLIFQVIIRQDIFAYNIFLTEIDIIRLFPLLIILSIVVFKSGLIGNKINGILKLLLSLGISIVYFLVFQIELYNLSDKIIMISSAIIGLFLYRILNSIIKIKYKNIISIVISIICGIVFYNIFTNWLFWQTTDWAEQFNIDVSLIIMFILLIMDLENYELSKINIFIFILLSFVILLINIVCTNNVISSAKEAYYELIQAIDQKKTSSELKEIINIYSDNKKMLDKFGKNFNIRYISGNYNHLKFMFCSINNTLEYVIDENISSNKSKDRAYSNLKNIVLDLNLETTYDAFKKETIKDYLFDFAINIILLIFVIIYRKRKMII